MPGTGAASPFRGANKRRPANMLLLLMAPLTSVMMLLPLICTQERYRLQQPASLHTPCPACSLLGIMTAQAYSMHDVCMATISVHNGRYCEVPCQSADMCDFGVTLCDVL